MESVIARNPEAASTLSYLLRVLLGSVLAFHTKGTWPRTIALSCHPAERPEQPDIVERVGLRARTRRGAAIDVVADRGRSRRGRTSGFPLLAPQASVRPSQVADGLAELQVRWPRSGPTATSRPPATGPRTSYPHSPASAQPRMRPRQRARARSGHGPARTGLPWPTAVGCVPRSAKSGRTAFGITPIRDGAWCYSSGV